jgi:tRNA-2-methylthio-N6-dimethylallyladenosine synthase
VETEQKEYMKLLGEITAGKEKRTGRKPTYFIKTMGCQMNARDSEKLAGILTEIGMEEAADEKADLLIFNTCTVRENANEKLYGLLGQAKGRKETNPDMIVAVCGCMMQEKDEVRRIRKSYPFVDIVFGTHNLWKFPELLYDRCSEGEKVFDILEESDVSEDNLPARRKYRFKSGVNIMYGCDNFCSYCIVPYVRGRERSREPEDILNEVRFLASDGVKEVMLLGQNVNSYGKNLPHPVSFSELLRKVCDVEGIERIRFMTSHPKDLSEDLIAAIRDNPKICRHLHLPLQSGSTEILQRMNRHYTKESYLSLIDRIKNEIPDIGLTTDIIVGFPGETEEDFADTLDVIRQCGFQSAFTFIYSRRSGTPASRYENQVPADVISERFQRLLSLVQELSSHCAMKDLGKTLPVLIEEKDSHAEGFLTGRLSNNLMVHFPGGENLIGQIADVTLKESRGFYYMGDLCDRQGK